MADISQGDENHVPRTVITERGRCATVASLAVARGWRRVFAASDAGVATAGLLERVTDPNPVAVTEADAARITRDGLVTC
jgi:hypothetical protein